MDGYTINVFYYQHKKENVILIATIISAIVNVGLNFILIENWREIATAFTTLIAESIMFGDLQTRESANL